AASAGDIAARIHAHLDAGCDLVLVCRPEWTAQAIAAVADRHAHDPSLLASLYGASPARWEDYAANPQRAVFLAQMAGLHGNEAST
ncbi:MAG: beta-N-acetylhexosaminidase, partial [Xanthomonadales bacterium]|nr:beta-N-acetylhexosaminidase [Xanthomonadales bacterium]